MFTAHSSAEGVCVKFNMMPEMGGFQVDDVIRTVFHVGGDEINSR